MGAEVAGIGEACRCGHSRSGDLPCYMCWDRTADEPLTKLMIDMARRREGTALPMLRQIGHPAAVGALRAALGDTDPCIRAAAVNSLGWSGQHSDVELIAPLLADEDVADEVVGSIAELGGPMATDLLWRVASQAGPARRLRALGGMSWWGDRRAHRPLQDLLGQSLGEPDGWHVAPGLLRYGDPADLDRIIAVVDARAREAGRDAGRSAAVFEACDQIAVALQKVRPEDLDAAVEHLHQILTATVERGQHWATSRRLHPALPRSVGPSPALLGAHPVRSLALRYGAEPPLSGAEPSAQFRGQPDWRGEPAWPIGADGHPITFYGQLPIGGDPARTAYIFIGGPDSWAPLGQGNAVVVQPGPPPHLHIRPLREGPHIFDWVQEDPPRFRDRLRRAPAPPRYASLQPWADPEIWERDDAGLDDGHWNKIGGTPLWLQNPDTPPGDGWDFAFQFGADSAGEELGDGAECYGFLNHDGTGALLWQCH